MEGWHGRPGIRPGTWVAFGRGPQRRRSQGRDCGGRDVDDPVEWSSGRHRFWRRCRSPASARSRGRPRQGPRRRGVVSDVERRRPPIQRRDHPRPARASSCVDHGPAVRFGGARRRHHNPHHLLRFRARSSLQRNRQRAQELRSSGHRAWRSRGDEQLPELRLSRSRAFPRSRKRWSARGWLSRSTGGSGRAPGSSTCSWPRREKTPNALTGHAREAPRDRRRLRLAGLTRARQLVAVPPVDARPHVLLRHRPRSIPRRTTGTS